VFTSELEPDVSVEESSDEEDEEQLPERVHEIDVDASSVEAELAANIMDISLAQQLTPSSPDVAMTPPVDKDDLLPPIGPNGVNVVSPMRPPSPPRQRMELTVAPIIPPAGLFEPETPFLSRLPPIDNTPPNLIADLLPLLPSDNHQIELQKTELEYYKRRTVLLDAKLRRERNKAKRLQQIVSCLEDLDHIAMDGPLIISTR
jgi:hypothetical protein